MIARWQVVPAWAVAIASFLITTIVLWWGYRKSGAHFWEVFPLNPVSLSWFIPMAITVLGLSFLLSEVDNLLRTVLPMPPWLAGLFNELTGSGWASVLTVVIVAPITEELLFRGVILGGFLSRYSMKKAVIASAVVFGLFHLNPWQFLGATVLGIVFAWWLIRTRSLLPCLFGHALNNGLPFLFGGLGLELPGYSSANYAEVVHQPMWLNVLGLLCTACGLWLTWLMFNHGKAIAADKTELASLG
jgi:uncharacterized protein